MPATLLTNLDEALTKPIYEQQTRLHTNGLATLKASLPARSYQAVFKADQTITTVRAEQESMKTETREQIKAHVRAVGKPPFSW